MGSMHPLTYRTLSVRGRNPGIRWGPVLRVGRWLAAGALVAGLAILPLINEAVSRRQIRRERARTLAAAKRVMVAAAPTPVLPPPGVRGRPWGTGVLVPSLMSYAVGNGGVVLSIQDGSWILIRVESSPNPKATLAVAVDSGGQWFVSDEHNAFAERFSDYRQVHHLWWHHRDAVKAGKTPPVLDGLKTEHMLRGINRQLSDIEGSRTLAEARQKLQRLGFQSTPP